MRNSLITSTALASLMITYFPINVLADTVALVPQPSECIQPSFTVKGNEWWSEVSIRLSNQCGQAIELQNATINFVSHENINTSFWGEFGNIAYPINLLQITSQPSGTNYIASLSLQMPSEEWSNTQLAQGQSITIQYGLPFSPKTYEPNSVKVYLQGEVEQASSLLLVNQTTKPDGVEQSPWVNLKNTQDSKQTNRFQLAWNSTQQINGLAPGKYAIQPETLTDEYGNTYQGQANPIEIEITAQAKTSSQINYTKTAAEGKMKIQIGSLPALLTGYSSNPEILLTQKNTGATTVKTVLWNTTNALEGLFNDTVYELTAKDIQYKGAKCNAIFTPSQLTSSNSSPQTSQLGYHCQSVKQVDVGLVVTGLPETLTTLDIHFLPNDGGPSITSTVNVQNGHADSTVRLNDGDVYTVSTDTPSGYSASFSQQPITAKQAAAQTIHFQKISAGKIITYLPGWVNPAELPTAKNLKEAGYTHVLVAFGVFSTTLPGQIVSAFPSVTKAYIDSLHAENIKVLLSIGGALTSLPNTSVNFHEVLTRAQSEQHFQDEFIASMNQFIVDYGFDGFDIDIEHGLNGSGAFSQPTGDINVMANIINQMHTNNPGLLITLAPQVANVAATSGFDGVWGNYASLIMQTSDALAWVGLQLYNTGCMFGIDQVCYANLGGNDQNFSVAMATDLLENWPAQVNNQNTGFQPYISYLRPDQVVLGYPAPNAQGHSDGAPTTNISAIKNAIQCLRTGNAGCDQSIQGFKPPRAYSTIGGVFNWEVTYDQKNGFKFAKELKPCVMDGQC